MRQLLTLLITVAVLASAAACGSEPDRGTPPDETPPPPSAAGSPTTGGPASATPGSPSPPATDPALPPPSRPAASPAAPPPGGGELPGGLPFGERKLTGVVERVDDCTLLRVGTRRWELIGTAAEGLSAGDRVTVEGQVTTAVPGCAAPEGTRALVVRRVT